MTFREILGHARAVNLLSRGVAQNTLPPSLIFAGPDSVGKFRVALALAQVLNCERPAADVARADAGSEGAPVLDSCGTCPTCRRIAAQRFSELIVLAPDEGGAIKIDAVRTMLGRVEFRPFEGRRRVVVIDQADQLMAPAQNALLKTLEEPSRSTCFVLVTARPDVLLPTVRSRCPQVRFGPLSAAEIATALVRDHGVAPDEAAIAASMAGGGLARALSDEAADYAAHRTVAERVLAAVARGPDPARRLEAARWLSERGEGVKVRRGSSAATDRAVVGERLAAMAALLRDVGVLASRAESRWLSNADRERALAALAAGFDVRRLVRAFSAVDEARQALERNVSPKTVSDWLAFQL